jgi:membrane complex biogenesis BtpA family protein
MPNQWFKDLFRVRRPVIAMAHVPALPGTPRYDAAGGMRRLIDHVCADVEVLLRESVDAVMFCNEDDRPYVLKAGIEQIAAMTRVVAEAAPQAVPFGVDFLWDPMAALAIAHATGAAFIREVLSGVYESDMGLWSPDAGMVMRFRRQINADSIRVFYNVMPEFASALGSRSLARRARSAIVSCLADAILVSGPMAGAEPDLSALEEVKRAAGEVPVLLNTGARADNIVAYLRVADGVIVGSSLKVEGHTWNPVDASRVRTFMEKVREARALG